ncbi:unnamed protein product [Vitrella brassicaformis CCMP3155]|uniref:TATA element modulatory factor 1 TATA binding domain-containing protein n=5 Tax=Vitrella brassicaformis TaxID=1169539 RepID=A0A0G4ELX8_VITBC|nr:unnamed protein product [Vitrella brassicaformis CCMP3155]|eukprot:CEL98429.1 unnamed protein product [Vitrella brassicaformis CCMP3155]
MKTFLDRAVTAAKSVKERVEREFDDAIKDGAEKPSGSRSAALAKQHTHQQQSPSPLRQAPAQLESAKEVGKHLWKGVGTFLSSQFNEPGADMGDGPDAFIGDPGEMSGFMHLGRQEAPKPPPPKPPPTDEGPPAQASMAMPSMPPHPLMPRPPAASHQSNGVPKLPRPPAMSQGHAAHGTHSAERPTDGQTGKNVSPVRAELIKPSASAVTKPAPAPPAAAAAAGSAKVSSLIDIDLDETPQTKVGDSRPPVKSSLGALLEEPSPSAFGAVGGWDTEDLFAPKDPTPTAAQPPQPPPPPPVTSSPSSSSSPVTLRTAVSHPLGGPSLDVPQSDDVAKQDEKIDDVPVTEVPTASGPQEGDKVAEDAPLLDLYATEEEPKVVEEAGAGDSPTLAADDDEGGLVGAGREAMLMAAEDTPPQVPFLSDQGPEDDQHDEPTAELPASPPSDDIAQDTQALIKASDEPTEASPPPWSPPPTQAPEPQAPMEATAVSQGDGREEGEGHEAVEEDKLEGQELAELRECLRARDDRIQRLESELRQTEETLREREKQLEKKAVQLSEVLDGASQTDSYIRRVQELEDQVSSLEATKATHLSDMEKLTSENDALKAELASASENHEGALQEGHRMSKELGETQARYRKAKKDLDAADRRAEQLTGQVSGLQKRVDTLQQEAADKTALETKLAELESDAQKSQGQLEAAKRDAADAKQKLTDLTKRYKEASAATQGFNQTKDALETLQREKVELLEVNQELQERIQDVHAQMSTLERSHEETVKNLRAEAAHYAAHLEVAQADFAKATAPFVARVTEVEERLKNERERLHSQLSSRDVELQEVKQKLSEASLRLQQTDAALTQLKMDAKDKDDERREAQRDARSARAELESTKEEMARLQTEMSQLRRSVDTKQGEVDAAKEAHQQEAKKLRKQLDDAAATLKMESERSEALSKQLAHLRSTLSQPPTPTSPQPSPFDSPPGGRPERGMTSDSLGDLGSPRSSGPLASLGTGPLPHPTELFNGTEESRQLLRLRADLRLAQEQKEEFEKACVRLAHETDQLKHKLSDYEELKGELSGLQQKFEGALQCIGELTESLDEQRDVVEMYRKQVNQYFATKDGAGTGDPATAK